MKYQIELNKEQLDIILSALDFYSRCGTGQLEEVAHLLAEKPALSWEVLRSEEFDEFKRKLTNLPVHSSHSICSLKVKQEFKEAYSIYTQIRQYLWQFDPNRNNYSVYKDGDLLKLSRQPEIKIKGLI